jgi:hypothetical protein
MLDYKFTHADMHWHAQEPAFLRRCELLFPVPVMRTARLRLTATRFQWPFIRCTFAI